MISILTYIAAFKLQNQFGQQSLGNQQGVQWFYPQFFQVLNFFALFV